MNSETKRSLLLASGISSFFVVIPYLVLLWSKPIGRDSGVFLYTGQIMQSGGLPYADSWDHKGLLIYLLNYAGLAIHSSISGVIFLEGILVTLSFFYASFVWIQKYGIRIGSLTTLLLILFFFHTFEGGNLSESWLFPFLLITYCCYDAATSFTDRSLQKMSRTIFPFVAGLTLSIALFTRPNNALGITFFILATFLTSRFKLKEWVNFVLPILVSASLIFTYLKSNNLVRDFWEQCIAFNFGYIQEIGFTSKLEQSALSLRFVSFTSLSILYAFISILFFARKVEAHLRTRELILNFTLLIDFFSQCMSGAGYYHYFLILGPVMATSFASRMNSIKNPGESSIKFIFKRNAMLITPIVGVLVTTILISGGMFASVVSSGTAFEGSERFKLIEWLLNNKVQKTNMLVFGNETWVLAATGSKSPTRLTYVNIPSHRYKNYYREYIENTLANPPDFILDYGSACGLTDRLCEDDATRFMELRTLLANSYFLKSSFEGYTLWKKR